MGYEYLKNNVKEDFCDYKDTMTTYSDFVISE